MHGESSVEAQKLLMVSIRDDFENRPDTTESRYIHHDHKDIDSYEYNEM